MNKDHINWDSVEKVHSTAEVLLNSTVLKQKEHLLLPEASTRAILQQFCTDKPTTLSHTKFTTLCLALSTQCPPLQVVLQDLYKEEL